jgi:hypothetical protein
VGHYTQVLAQGQMSVIAILRQLSRRITLGLPHRTVRSAKKFAGYCELSQLTVPKRTRLMKIKKTDEFSSMSARSFSRACSEASRAVLG